MDVTPEPFIHCMPFIFLLVSETAK